MNKKQENQLKNYFKKRELDLKRGFNEFAEAVDNATLRQRVKLCMKILAKKL